MGFLRHDAGQPPADVYGGLRAQVLGLNADQLGESATDAPLLAMLMEFRNGETAVTLAGVVDGTTSLYFANGGGIIGAGERPEVAAATRRWLAAAAMYLPVLAVVTEVPLPAEGEARFVAVTPDGLQACSTAEIEWRERRHPLWPLYLLAHQVITQIRLAQAA